MRAPSITRSTSNTTPTNSCLERWSGGTKRRARVADPVESVTLDRLGATAPMIKAPRAKPAGLLIFTQPFILIFGGGGVPAAATPYPEGAAALVSDHAAM